LQGMRGKNTAILLILLLLPTAFAGVEAMLYKHYYNPDEELVTHINIDENYTGSADLKFCLANFDFEELTYNYKCDIFLNNYNISFDKTYSADFTQSLAGIEPLIYRLFVQLHFEDKYHKDSDSDNFIYITKPDNYVIHKFDSEGVIINALSTPKEVQAGEELSITFNVSNHENCTNYCAYSFIVKNNKCVTGGLNKNIVNLTLPLGSSTSMTLTNIVNSKAEPAEYDYTIRVSGCGKNYDLTQPVQIVSDANPDIDYKLEKDGLLVKNYGNANISFELRIMDENQTRIITGEVTPYSQKKIFLNQTTQYLELAVNNEQVLEKLITHPVIIIQNNTIEELGSITSNAVLNSFDEGKSFYILSIFTSITALMIMYKRLR